MTEKHRRIYNNSVKRIEFMSGVYRSLGGAIVNQLKKELIRSETGSLESRRDALEEAMKLLKALRRLPVTAQRTKKSSIVETCAFNGNGSRIEMKNYI